jgi:osmotically-inducible protein OsmY
MKFLGTFPRRVITAGRMVTGVAAVALGFAVLAAPAGAQGQSDPGVNQQRAAAGGDSSTAARVKAALTSDPNLDAKHVDVSVDKGDVVLQGFVQSTQDLTNATRIATRAAGDHKVINHLTINQNYPNAP